MLWTIFGISTSVFRSGWRGWGSLYTHESPKFIRSICAQRYSATYLSKRKFLVLPDIRRNSFCEGFISRAEGIRQNTSAFGNTNFKSTGIFSLHSATANPGTVKCCFQMFVSEASNPEKIGGFAFRNTKGRKARIDLFVVKQLKSTKNNFLQPWNFAHHNEEKSAYLIE